MQVERVLVRTDRYTFVMWFRDQTKYPWNIIFISCEVTLGKRLSTMAENSLVIVLSFLSPLSSLFIRGTRRFVFVFGLLVIGIIRFGM